MIWTVLSSRWGQYALIGGALALVVGGVLLYVYNQGEAAAVAAAAAAGMTATAKANRARAKVVPEDKAAMDADPFNRSRGKKP